MNRAASFLSYLFHPLLMPFYSLYIIFSLPVYLKFTVPMNVQLIIYGLVLFTTFLMPALSSIILFKRGTITDLHLNDARERLLPFMITAAYFFLCYYLFMRLQLPQMLKAVILGAAIAATIALIINFFYKISIHMIGIGGLFGMLIALSQYLLADFTFPIIFVALLSGLLGTSRYLVGTHTRNQIYLGFITGGCVQFVTLNLYMHLM